VLAGTGADKKSAEAEVEGVRYKVVWSCLLLVEMLMTNMACGAHFPSLSTNVVGKIAELLRMFNSRTTQLVLD
jgi:vacuolar protein sorting-associated protein 54